MKNLNIALVDLLLCFLLIKLGQSAPSVDPVWKPNDYFQTEKAQIKTNLNSFFNQSSPITKTFTFTKTYTQIPQLGFGIKNYRGSDTFYQQSFAITRTALTNTGFTIYTMIVGYTNIRILTIIYLAVNKQFPYHLNVFNDIPVNYLNGVLVNITGNVSPNSARTYSNTINYTTLAQSIGATYTKFGGNLAKNYVALYLCAIYNRANYLTSDFVRVQITNEVLNLQQFRIKVVVQPKYNVTLLRFSIVTMDIESVQKSGKFTIVFQQKKLDATINQYIPIPKQFAAATFIGLLDYSAKNTSCGLDFNWQLDPLNNIISINASYPPSGSLSTATDGLLSYRVVIFYVKTWQCPATHLYFNLDTNMCDDYCAKYLYENSTAKQCQPCNFGCYQCIYGPAAGCTDCNPADNRQLDIGTKQCKCKSGYSPNPNASLTECVTCASQLTNCATCQKSGSGTFTCLTCASGFGWTGTTCVTCVIVGCTTASYNGSCKCTQCSTSSGYVSNGVGGCSLCSVYFGASCKKCTSQTVCTECVSGLQLFINATTNKCETCNLLQCTTCNSLETCLTCNTTADYFLNSTDKCQKCTLIQCLDCTSLSQCLICNTTADYFLNSTDKCQKCTLNQCLDCTNLSQCYQCNTTADYFLNGSTCQACSLTGCADCTSLAICQTCDVAHNYFSNGPVCQLCSLTGCTNCSSLTQCAKCNQTADYFLNGNTCLFCPLPQCTDCATISTCAVCNVTNDYFLNALFTCQKCTLNQCLDCSSLSQCLICNTTADYFLNSTDKCQKCTLNQCLDCGSLSVCLWCNQTNNFFLNASSNQCQACVQMGCSTCATLATCSVCDISNLYDKNLTNSQCFYCDPISNMFVNSSSLCQLCSLSQCILCSSLSTCSLCNATAAFFVNTTDSLCYPCPLAGCLTCQNLTACAICDTANNWGLTSDGTCKQCPFTCACDGYVLPKYVNSTTGIQYCSTVCGDGLVRNFEECDDGDTIEGDGCSSQCTIENAWSCNANPTYTCCTLESTKLDLLINKIIKIPNKNSMTLELQVKPKLSILTPQNMHKFVNLTVSGIPLYNEVRNAKNAQVMEVTYDYNASVHGKKGNIIFEIVFSQAKAPSCVIRALKNITIMAQANNNLPFMFYTDEELQKQDDVAESVNALEIITYAILFLSMIPCKIIGLELIGVLQLAYFSLAQQDNINMFLQPFMRMNEINGLNVDMVSESQDVPDQVSALGIKALFLNNCNVMLLLIIVQVSAAALLYAAGHLLKSFSQKLSSISKFLIKEGLLTLMMFNAFNIAFGVGIHFQYAQKSNDSYTLSSLAAILSSALIFAACALLIFTQGKQFGEFKNKFKRDPMSQLYFVFSLAYRFALGYYIAVKAEYILSSLVILAFSVLFIMYNLINLPFKEAYQNYRANICHVTQLVILMVTNYYDSLLENDPLEEKAYQFSAAQIQIGAMYTAVAFSGVCLVVQFYKFFKAKFKTSAKKSSARQIKQMLPSESNQTQDIQISNHKNNIFQQNQIEQLQRK